MKVFPKSLFVALHLISGICIHETVPCSSGPAVREKMPRCSIQMMHCSKRVERGDQKLKALSIENVHGFRIVRDRWGRDMHEECIQEPTRGVCRVLFVGARACQEEEFPCYVSQ